MPKSQKSSRAAVEERLERTENMVSAGLGTSQIERALTKQYGVTPRQVRNYISEVHNRWQAQAAVEAPHRREKVYRMAEQFFVKAQGEKQYTAASRALGILAKMSGGFAQHNPERDARYAELGPPPQDPTQALVWVQRCMTLSMEEVITNLALEPERRLRWIAEFGGKIGMTHAKTLMEANLSELENRVFGTSSDEERAPDTLDETKGITWPETSRFGGRHTADNAPGGPGARDSSQDDG